MTRVRKIPSLIQHLHEIESEHQKLHGKFRHEAAVGHLRGSVVDFEAVRSELVKRLNTNARLDALPEQSMHQVRDELHLAVSGFRASEEESESEQYRVFLVRAQEIAGMEQQVADQVARVSHAEHRVNEEHAAICRHKQMHDYEAQQELDRLRSECSQSRIDFLGAIKDAGALQREQLRKDEHTSHLQRSLEEANSGPSNSSWQMVNSPDDSERKDFAKQWISYRTSEQLNSALTMKDEETKVTTRESRRATVAAPSESVS